MTWKLLISRLLKARAYFAERLAQFWKHSFYLYLAGLFSVFAVLDTTVLHYTSEMRQSAFDAMVRYRIVVPKPDPDIIIVDINEASLAAMAQDYGRWPWPRQVLGEFLEQIEKQQPKAVVFDILFSDADVYNPDSDAYFNAAIAATRNTFFPMLRLDPANDKLSLVKPSMIPGVRPLPGAQPDATVAMVLPNYERKKFMLYFLSEAHTIQEWSADDGKLLLDAMEEGFEKLSDKAMRQYFWSHRESP